MTIKGATLCMVLLLVQGASNANSRDPVGWVLDPVYVEVTTDVPDGAFRRMFVPDGESAEDWSERVRIDSFPNSESHSPSELLDQLAAEYRVSCPLLNDHRMPLPDTVSDTVGVTLWHCPEHARSGRGEVLSHKLLLHDGAAYVLLGEGRYPPFEPGKTPLLREQLNRWTRMQQSFLPCNDYTNPGCLPDADTLVTAVPVALSPEESEAVARTEARAREIFLQDQLAWHATDFALDEKLLDGKRGGHFLAVPNAEGGGSVYFIPERRFGRPKAHRVDALPDGSFALGARNLKLEGETALRYAALREALNQEDLKLCSANVNSAVLPREDGNGWIVYVLSATTEPGKAFIGGHNRIVVGANGTVGSVEHSARSCIGIDATVSGPDGAKVAYQLVSHVISDMPWETHIFQAMTLDVQMFVPTEHAVWRIEGGRLWKLAVE